MISCDVCFAVLYVLVCYVLHSALCVGADGGEQASTLALDVCSWRCQTDVTSTSAVCQRDELLYI